MNKTATHNPRLKVLFLINNLSGGGAEKVLLHILRHLDRRRFQVHLFLVCREGVYLNQLPDDIIVHSVFKDKMRIASPVFRFLYRAFRSLCLSLCMRVSFFWKSLSGMGEYYDVGISFLEGYATSLLTLQRDHFGKILGWFHNDVSALGQSLDKAQLSGYQSFDRLYFVSETCRQGFLRCYPDFISKLAQMQVVYNPVDTISIGRTGTSFALEKPKGITLVAIGRLTPQKRFDKLLRVHRRLLDKGIRHCVYILGEGELREELQDQILRLEIQDTCFLKGFCDPYPYLRGADAFVMTSDYEGLPVVLCEAMLMGVPCVVTDVSGSGELLEEGKYGIIVQNDERSIEEGLERMILDSELRLEFVSRLMAGKERFIFSDAMKTLEEKLLSL